MLLKLRYACNTSVTMNIILCDDSVAVYYGSSVKPLDLVHIAKKTCVRGRKNGKK